MKQSALIAMSGGVDSSVAALLMCRQGFDCLGITMKLYDNDDVGLCRDRTCCSENDIADARIMAGKLNMPYYVVNFRDNFKEQVIDRFIEAYRQGRTPNPCIDCNRYLKFQRLFQRGLELDLDYIVTGHYASIELDPISGRYLLKKGLDDSKDQSYVLYALTQEQLQRTLLPLGKLNKSQVRTLAEENGFINARKRDSQDICFVKDGDYAGFIESYTGVKSLPGNFVDSQGQVLGQHCGLIRYTIGQRRGLGVAKGYPLYVCAKNVQDNTVTLGPSEDLLTKAVIVSDLNMIACEELREPMKVQAKIRYKQQERPATIEPSAPGEATLIFESPVSGVASGQAAVFYQDQVVVGGGTIVGCKP